MAKTDKTVEIRNLKPGRKFSYPWNEGVEGELVRLSAGSAIVTLKRTDTVLDVDDEGNEVERQRKYTERNVGISLSTRVTPRNRTK